MFSFSWDRIYEHFLESHSKMPSSCCFPNCSKKSCRDEDGKKGSFYQLPHKKVMRKNWIHAIRRDEEHFQITKWTNVCSRNYMQYDFIKTPSGKRDLQLHAALPFA